MSVRASCYLYEDSDIVIFFLEDCARLCESPTASGTNVGGLTPDRVMVRIKVITGLNLSHGNLAILLIRVNSSELGTLRARTDIAPS